MPCRCTPLESPRGPKPHPHRRWPTTPKTVGVEPQSHFHPRCELLQQRLRADIGSGGCCCPGSPRLQWRLNFLSLRPLTKATGRRLQNHLSFFLSVDFAFCYFVFDLAASFAWLLTTALMWSQICKYRYRFEFCLKEYSHPLTFEVIRANNAEIKQNCSR